MTCTAYITLTCFYYNFLSLSTKTIFNISGISLKQVLEASLGPISWSLTNTDGSIYKSVKSKLLQSLEKDIPTMEEVNS